MVQSLVLLTMMVLLRVNSGAACRFLNTLFTRAFLTCFFVFSIRSTGMQSPLCLGKGRGSLALVVWGCNLWALLLLIVSSSLRPWMPALKVPSLGGRGFSSREVVKQVLKVVKQDLGFIAVYLP